MEIIISILGAVSAILVAVLGAVLSNKNNNKLQIRKLKEDHYISYVEALHNLAAKNGDQENISKYTFHRDKLLVVASEEVVRSILKYENEAVGKTMEIHDEYLTYVIKTIRKDLKIKDRHYPKICFKK